MPGKHVGHGETVVSFKLVSRAFSQECRCLQGMLVNATTLGYKGEAEAICSS